MADSDLDEGDASTALVPIREEHVQFYGDDLLGAQVADGTIYVPLRLICDYLQLNWSGQRQRAQRDKVLAEGLKTVQIHTVQGARPALCLPLNLLPGWLFGLNETRVRPDLEEKITRYRRECFEVLWRAFMPQPAPPPAAVVPRTGAEMALEIAEAVATLAREQVELEGKYTTMADYVRGHIQKTNQTLRNHESRIGALELKVQGPELLTEPQVAEIGEAVKQIAEALGAEDGKEHYQPVYRELYRRYAIGSYRNMRQEDFEDARAWLHAWFLRVAPPPPPGSELPAGG